MLLWFGRFCLSHVFLLEHMFQVFSLYCSVDVSQNMRSFLFFCFRPFCHVKFDVADFLSDLLVVWFVTKV